eukprot:682892-Rhodomonas_salina.3
MSLGEWYLDEGIRPGEEDAYFDRIERESKICDAGYLPASKWKDAILRCQECRKGISSDRGDAKVRHLKAEKDCEEKDPYCPEATVQYVLSNGLAHKTYCCMDCAHTAAQRWNEAIYQARRLREEAELQARRAARRQRLQEEEAGRSGPEKKKTRLSDVHCPWGKGCRDRSCALMHPLVDEMCKDGLRCRDSKCERGHG